MDFTLSEEHKMLQTTIRDIATNKLALVADELDRKQEFAWDNFKVMAEMGYRVGSVGGGTAEYEGSTFCSDKVLVRVIAQKIAEKIDVINMR